MEQTEKSFELSISGQFDNRPLTVTPDETTDHVPIYHCYLDGISVSQLRQEPAGKWVQIWGDWPITTVQQVGEAITKHLQ